MMTCKDIYFTIAPFWINLFWLIVMDLELPVIQIIIFFCRSALVLSSFFVFFFKILASLMEVIYNLAY